MENSHAAGLVLPRTQDGDETDLEVTEIVAGTRSNCTTSEPKEGEISPNRFFDVYEQTYMN